MVEWSGTRIFGGGYASNDSDIFDVCKNKEPIDYKIVDDWIKTIN
jgi:hypothetical protein